MDGCELRDALKTLFEDDVSIFAEAVAMGRRNATNLVMGRYGVTGPLRVLVRLLMCHPEFVGEIREEFTASQQLDNLEAALVEDILATPDEELIAEIIEDGGDPDAMAAQCQKIFGKVKDNV